MKNIHTDPHFLIADPPVLNRFLRKFQIDSGFQQGDVLLAKLCGAFAEIPYENLTKIIKSDIVISAGSAKRLPDEVIRDYLRYGTGGTCFSLTAAFIAILNAVGIEAHPILADRRYGTDTHCALVIVQDAGLHLLDPGFLIDHPVPLPTTLPNIYCTGFNRIELCPRDAGQKVELWTIVKNDRRFRLTYKINPVDGPGFGRAWERSFAWEMMTYPVLTRYRNNRHYYLQGDTLRIRSAETTVKQVLSGDEQYECIRKTFGVNPEIIKHTFAVM